MAKRKSHTGKFTSRLVKPVNQTSGSCRACSETGLGGEAACVLILSSAFFPNTKGGGRRGAASVRGAMLPSSGHSFTEPARRSAGTFSLRPRAVHKRT